MDEWIIHTSEGGLVAGRFCGWRVDFQKKFEVR